MLKKYLLHAIGEILLVVVGILIALQINSWNAQVNEPNQEAHFCFDSETALFEPAYRTQDINRFIKSYIYNISEGAEGEDVKIAPDEFNVILNNLKQKNG